MIGLLNGTVAYREEQHILVDVNGVGYKVLVPVTVSAAIGQPVKLFTHTHVREDVLELYGFIQPQDLKLFEYLISVSGVGCKTALGVFSVGSRQEIINAIAINDVGFFTSVPRLGKKNAQKIIIELKNKLADGGDFDFASDGQGQDEVLAALKAFGFSTSEARNALKGLSGQGETVEEKIRLALKYLGK